MNISLKAILYCAFPVLCFAQSEQAILDKGGRDAESVIHKAYEELAETKIFECRDVGWGTPSASCWALTVLVRYAPEDDIRNYFFLIHEDKKNNIALRLYAAIGLQLLYPDNAEVASLLTDKDFLASPLSWASGCTSVPGTVSDVLSTIKNDEGGIKELLFKKPIPPLYKTRHAINPDAK